MITIKGPIKLGKGSNEEDLKKMSKAIGKPIYRHGQLVADEKKE